MRQESRIQKPEPNEIESAIVAVPKLVIHPLNLTVFPLLLHTHTRTVVQADVDLSQM